MLLSDCIQPCSGRAQWEDTANISICPLRSHSALSAEKSDKHLISLQFSTMGVYSLWIIIKVSFSLSVYFYGKYWCFCQKNKFMVVSEETWSCLRIKPEEWKCEDLSQCFRSFQNPNNYIVIANLEFPTDYFSDSFFSLNILHFCENCVFQTDLQHHSEHLHDSTSPSLWSFLSANICDKSPCHLFHDSYIPM